jgi:hypothetical protein
MLTRTLRAAMLGLACVALPALAAPSVTVTASSGSFYSLADSYSAATNPASSAISDAFGDVEFLSEDFILAFDFRSDGGFDLWGLAALASGSYDFDFTGLGGRLFAASWDGTASGLTLTVLDDDSLRLSVDGAKFTPDDAAPFTGRFSVPEPAGLSLLALVLLALVHRRHARRA